MVGVAFNSNGLPLSASILTTGAEQKTKLLSHTRQVYMIMVNLSHICRTLDKPKIAHLIYRSGHLMGHALHDLVIIVVYWDMFHLLFNMEYCLWSLHMHRFICTIVCESNVLEFQQKSLKILLSDSLHLFIDYWWINCCINILYCSYSYFIFLFQICLL